MSSDQLLSQLDGIMSRFAGILTSMELREVKPAELMKVLESAWKLRGEIVAGQLPADLPHAGTAKEAGPVLLRESLQQWNERHQCSPAICVP